MKVRRNPDGKPCFWFELENGWTASVLVLDGGAYCDCVCWPTSVKEGTEQIEHHHSEASDNEVVEFLRKIKRRAKRK